MKRETKIRFVIFFGTSVMYLLLMALYYKITIQQDVSMNFPGSCPIHHEQIIYERVIAPKLILTSAHYESSYDEAYIAAKKELFQYSGKHFIYDRNGGNYAGKWVRWVDRKSCEACIIAERQWQSDWLTLASSPSEKSITDLNEKELNELRIRAVEGDAAAAYQVFLYYAATSKTGIEGFEWLIIAVKAKHPRAIESFNNLNKQGAIDVWIEMLNDNPE